MKSEEITYENMVDKMIETLPELRSAFAKESASWTEVQGPHIIYSFVLYDSLKAAMNALEANQALIQRIFDFLEILANHPEEHVQEALAQFLRDARTDRGGYCDLRALEGAGYLKHFAALCALLQADPRSGH